MVVAAFIGLGLGVTGGVMLGGQLFKGQAEEEPGKFHHLDMAGDDDENVPEPYITGSITAENREVLKHAPNWLVWPDFEQVKFLNSTIEWLWPNLSKAICKMVTDMIGPILEDIVSQQPLLDAVVVETLDFGSEQPRLGGVKVYDTRDDEVIMEVPLQWGSNCKIHASACVRIGPASIYVPVKVDNLQMDATARITIRPLTDTLPCLGAVTVCLVNAPYVDLSLKLINDWDLMALPFVHGIAMMVTKKVTEQMLVYPNQITVPLMPNSGLPMPPCGMLEVTLERLTGLKGATDFVGKGDPYVTIGTQKVEEKDGEEVVVAEGTKHTSSQKHNTKSPEFNEHFRVLISELGPQQTVAFQVFDYDIIGQHPLMCEYNLPLDRDNEECEFLRVTGEPHSRTFSLNAPRDSYRRKAGEQMGEITMSLQYTPFFRSDAPAENGDKEDPARAMEAMVQAQQGRRISDASKGVLSIDLMRCVDLPTVGKTCDSYVVFHLTDPDGDGKEATQERRTDVVLNEPSPRFRQKFDFVYISAASTLIMTVYDKTGTWELDNIMKLGKKEDTPLGKVRINVKDVARTGRVKDAFPLQEADQGDVHMALTWTAVEKEE